MGKETAVAERFTSADLALMPDDSKRYEIIEGETEALCHSARR
jgi:hypothetical protein